MKHFLLLAAVLLPWTTSASAITVDGVRDAEYGAAIAVQAVQTQFGDEGMCDLGTEDCGGELDAAYAKFENGRLFLMIAGNLEADSFNKLNIFIDSVAGGENVMSGTPQYDFFNGTKWISENYATMTFDTGFSPDYHLFSRGGFGNYEVDFVNRQGGVNAQVPGASAGVPMGGAPGAQTATGIVPAGDLGPNAVVSSLSQNLEFGYDNSNNLGVSGGTGPADQVAAAAVTTGMEFSIALNDLGNPAVGATIRISALYNNGDHNYLSNQVLGTFTAPQANPGGDGSNPGEPVAMGGFTGTMAGMNFNNFTGDQFFSLVVPAPAFNDGDHNQDGIVDAADYVAWRKTDAGNQAGYDAFFENFGEGGGGGSSGGVPEPGSLLLAAIGGLLTLSLRRRK